MIHPKIDERENVAFTPVEVEQLEQLYRQLLSTVVQLAETLGKENPIRNRQERRKDRYTTK